MQLTNLNVIKLAIPISFNDYRVNNSNIYLFLVLPRVAVLLAEAAVLQLPVGDRTSVSRLPNGSVLPHLYRELKRKKVGEREE